MRGDTKSVVEKEFTGFTIADKFILIEFSRPYNLLRADIFWHSYERIVSSCTLYVRQWSAAAAVAAVVDFFLSLVIFSMQVCLFCLASSSTAVRRSKSSASVASAATALRT